MDDQEEPETVLETVQKWAEHFHSLKSFPERTVAITEHLQRTKNNHLPAVSKSSRKYRHGSQTKLE